MYNDVHKEKKNKNKNVYITHGIIVLCVQDEYKMYKLRHGWEQNIKILQNG